MSRKGELICIIGTDGAGKTTQARNLQEYLESRGISVKYTWGKFGSKYTKAIIEFIKQTLSLSGKDMENHESRSETKNSFLDNRVVRVTYLVYVLTAYYLQLLRRVVIPLYTNDVVICDRYVHDTIVDLMVDYEYSGDRGRQLLAILFVALPQPDRLVYIDISPEVSLERKDDIPTEQYIVDKKNAYTELLADIEVEAIDGTQSKKAVFSEIAARYND